MWEKKVTSINIIPENTATCTCKLYVVRHHESHIMSEKQYFSLWQIWILQILCFKSIYTICQLPSLLLLPSKELMESLKFSFPSVFLASWAIHMISDFIRVTWWRTTYEVDGHGVHCAVHICILKHCKDSMNSLLAAHRKTYIHGI